MVWTYHTYRWPSESDWLAALAAEGWINGAPPNVDLLVSGILYLPRDEENVSLDAIAGWHVAAAFRDRAPPVAWAAQTIDPPDFMPVLGKNPVPQSVSRFQARAALALANLLPTVEAAIANSNNVVAQLAWADAVQFDRNSPTIAAMASALNLTDAQVDNLFINAAKISA